MDFSPLINIACMGGLGYGFGLMTKSNPKNLVITWLVAETAIQLFRHLDGFDRKRLENPTRVIVGSIACLYLNDNRLIAKTTHAIVSLAGFCLFPELMKRIQYNSYSY
jgi:hypothetical protein